jgi:hypothetical protein
MKVHLVALYNSFAILICSLAPEVVRAVGVLASKAASSSVSMNPGQLSRAIFGLQGMRAEFSEVRSALSALSAKMDDCSEVFVARDIGYCLSGLSSMGLLHPEAVEIRNALIRKVSQTEFADKPDVLFLQFGKGIRVKKSSE